jgi:AcrR family transcriptional regulator
MITSSSSDLNVEDGRIRRGMKTREQLLDAAIELFGSKGFAATSMKDLAAAAGVRAPAIYNHFTSKERILAEALVWALEDFKHLVIDTDDPTWTPMERLEHLVRGHVTYQIEHAKMVRAADSLVEAVALGELLTPADQEDVRKLIRGYRDLMAAVIDSIRAETDADIPPTSLSVLAILTLCDQVRSWYRVDGELTIEDVSDAYWSLILGMLRLA